MPDLADLLSANPYPGRMVGCARTGNGEVTAFYALTGRSAASRNRRLVPAGDGSLSVESVTTAEHDPLRHYVAVINLDRWTVVGNGEQVAATAGQLAAGLPPAEALDNLPYEPDGPIFTSRITAVCDREHPGTLVLAAARRARSGRTAADLLTVSVSGLALGEVLLLTTYETDAGGTVGIGAPYLEASTAAANAGDLLDSLWGSLPPALRVAAATVPVTGTPAYLIRQA